MYIFHYQMKIKEMDGMNCVALSNPLLSNVYDEVSRKFKQYSKTLKIVKVEISSKGQVDVGLYAAPIVTINPEQNISGYIRDASLDGSLCSAIATCEPSMVEPVVPIKSASIQDGNQRKLIDASDYLMLPPGKSLVLRAVPTNPYQVIHITIVFDEKESDIL